MPVKGNILSGWAGAWIERRAALMTDPVMRLRYLRRTARPARRKGRLPFAGGILASLMLVSAATVFAPPPHSAAERTPSAAPPPIWLVDRSVQREIYSNGLQVDISQTVRNTPRPSAPSGIVYHTSESQLVEFEPAANKRLKLLGRGLVAYIRQKQAYHYLIDRFGRVYRIVNEDDTAFHAGHSIWADTKKEYVGLNDKFLGIVFESQSRPGDELPAITAAQTHAARVLTDMLRSRYRIAAENCVTHAQVSVNPQNFLVGWHTDWAGNFPFTALGLPDNYQQPLPAIVKFGFSYDAAFFAATGAQMWRGIVAAEDRLRVVAAREGISVAELRQRLRNDYLTRTRINRSHKEKHS